MGWEWEEEEPVKSQLDRNLFKLLRGLDHVGLALNIVCGVCDSSSLHCHLQDSGAPRQSGKCTSRPVCNGHSRADEITRALI